eukprot:758819-Hanusia_phi.AAC.7
MGVGVGGVRARAGRCTGVRGGAAIGQSEVKKKRVGSAFTRARGKKLLLLPTPPPPPPPPPRLTPPLAPRCCSSFSSLARSGHGQPAEVLCGGSAGSAAFQRLLRPCCAARRERERHRLEQLRCRRLRVVPPQEQVSA